MHLIQSLGPFIIVPVIFVAVGIGSFIHIFLGLVTGGPRALQLPGAPYLYDRVYYLLSLLALIGWSFALVSFVHSATTNRLETYGFMVGWGVLAIAMGSLFLLRGEIMIKAREYQAVHGFWLWRIFHQTTAGQYSQRRPTQKLTMWIFIVAGIGVLAFNVPHLPAALQEFQAGLQDIATLAATIANPKQGA